MIKELMSVDELTKKTTIDFPIPIGRKDAEDLLFHLSSRLPANVSGKIEYFIGYLYDSKEESSLEDKGTLKLTAGIRKAKDTFASDILVSEPYNEDTSLISRIRFDTAGKDELSDYRPEVRELWDDVRKVINEYFMEKFGKSVYSKGEES